MVTSSESILDEPYPDGIENCRATVRSVWDTPPGMLKGNASSPAALRKLSTSTVMTVRPSAQAASVAASHTPRSTAALFI